MTGTESGTTAHHVARDPDRASAHTSAPLATARTPTHALAVPAGYLGLAFAILGVAMLSTAMPRLLLGDTVPSTLPLAATGLVCTAAGIGIALGALLMINF